MDEKSLTKNLMDILSKAMNNKIYGSIEVYLEEGAITQISQRIIQKVQKPKAKKKH